MIGTFNRLTSDTLQMLRDDKSAKKIVSKTLKEKDLDGDDEDDEEEDEDENENAMREMLTNEYLEGDKKITWHFIIFQFLDLSLVIKGICYVWQLALTNITRQIVCWPLSYFSYL